MKLIGAKCIQVGLGREFESKDGSKHRDMLARCINEKDAESLCSDKFFDVKLPEEAKAKAKELVGKVLDIDIEDLRQPYAGAPITISGKILKAA